MYLKGIINSINVFACYFLLIVVLSSFILNPKVKRENIFKRFIIYLVFGNFYISSIVFVLAYLKMFNRVNLITFIVLLSLLIRFILDRSQIKDKILNARKTFDNIALGRYGFKVFIYDKGRELKNKIKGLLNELLDGKKIEWILFIAIISYNVYQYGINNFKFITYMAPDEEVHLYWIQSLIGGNIYPSGIYPHVFHNIMASVVEIFGLNAATVLRYFGPTSCILIMTMLYFGLRKIFNTKYPALFGFLMYSIIHIYSFIATYRFQFVIPQEYAMIMLMPIAIFLFDYIKNKKLMDLFFFGIALSLTVGIHFYTGIIGIILTFSIVIVYLYKIIKEKILLKLILCGILSGAIAITPIAVGLALGYEMEQSMSWASEVIRGDIYKSNNKIEEGLTDDLEKETPTEIEVDKKSELETLLRDIKKSMTTYVVKDIKVIYIFLGITVLTIIFNLLHMILKKDEGKSGYKIAFVLNNLMLVFLMLFRSLEWPTIMETKRVAIFFAYFSPTWIGIPLEIITNFFRGEKIKKAIPFLSFGTMGLAVYLVLNFNLIRPIPPFYYFQTTGTMISDMKIMQDYQDYTWTVVSPVNNISPILNHGFHYELSDFIKLQENWDKKKEIRIPTEYVFIFIEKKPIVKYGWRFHADDPGIANRESIKREDAYKEFAIENEDGFTYRKERNILMAKAYYWAKEYKKYFPDEMDIYYEDSELIVYRVKQNVYAINNFNIDYGMNKK